MSVRFHILSDLGLVYVRYEGEARIADSIAAFQSYATHPEFRPGQKQLVDMAGLTALENDFVKVMNLQSIKAGTFMKSDAQTLMVYYAPSAISYKVATLSANAWIGVTQVVARIQRKEEDALSLLGLPFRDMSGLLRRIEQTQPRSS